MTDSETTSEQQNNKNDDYSIHCPLEEGSGWEAPTHSSHPRHCPKYNRPPINGFHSNRCDDNFIIKPVWKGLTFPYTDATKLSTLLANSLVQLIIRQNVTHRVNTEQRNIKVELCALVDSFPSVQTSLNILARTLVSLNNFVFYIPWDTYNKAQCSITLI